MSHTRKDSMMTHSSRKSYKEKYLAAKAGIPDTDEQAQTLNDISDLHSVQELKREELHKLLQEVAEATSDLVVMLDSKDGQFGFKVKDMRRPIDANLPMMDGNLIARRTRDVLRAANARIGMAGLGINDLRESIQNLTTGVSLLKPSLGRIQRGMMESYVIGASPKHDEMTVANEEYGKNPRLQNYMYETDESDSEDDIEKEASQKLVPASPSKITKPAGRSPASRRVKDTNEIDIV